MDKPQAPPERHFLTEEQLKTQIFFIYQQCKCESSSDRRQTNFGRLCERIFKWCKEYSFVEIAKETINDYDTEADNMGVEICQIVIRLINSDKVLENENNFFKYLYKCLDNARTEYYLKSLSGVIKIPRRKLISWKQMQDAIDDTEKRLARKITKDEGDQLISELFGLDRKKFETIHSMQNPFSLDFVNNDDEKIDNLNKDVRQPYMMAASNSPSEIFILKHDEHILMEAVKEVLKKRQKRVVECCRALFTVYCMENIKNIKNYEKLSMILDNEILEESMKDGNIPNQYEIYLRYHPNVKKRSAEVRSSEILGNFLKDICAKLERPINGKLL